MKSHPGFLLVRDHVEAAFYAAAGPERFRSGEMINELPVDLRICADKARFLEGVTSLATLALDLKSKETPLRLFSRKSPACEMVVEFTTAQSMETLAALLIKPHSDESSPHAEDNSQPYLAMEALASIGCGVRAEASPDGKARLVALLPCVRPRILVVDDDPTYVELIIERLREVDGDILTASTGLEALTKLAEEAPHVVVVDLNMPAMNGQSLIGAMRLSSKTTRLPIIVFSSSTEHEIKMEALNAGAYKYLVKPEGLRSLAEVVNQVLFKRRMTE